ncbi:hypothetical protein [Microvirga yunnanensis]|uniref:hypothetical protein n=1 Tax=Microvirga yunnanensis TaxID=2953740 RepID=UPI0021C8805B|nr:hypothetical protein [Microvirga sp. HBU65207]
MLGAGINADAKGVQAPPRLVAKSKDESMWKQIQLAHQVGSATRHLDNLGHWSAWLRCGAQNRVRHPCPFKLFPNAQIGPTERQKAPEVAVVRSRQTARAEAPTREGDLEQAQVIVSHSLSPTAIALAISGIARFGTDQNKADSLKRSGCSSKSPRNEPMLRPPLHRSATAFIQMRAR